MDPPPAILVLGAPRSGTSCLAGMLAAAGAAVPGAQVRNWDNPRGHFEAAAAVRLSERVLARSGGSWLQAAPGLAWDAAEAAERDRLLAPVSGRPALIKDPRVLLSLRFWLASEQPLALVATLRHPLAMARSMASWRRLPLDDGLRLWLDHARSLLAVVRERGVPVLDFDAAPADFTAAVAALAPRLWPGLDAAAAAGHYDAAQVHHDGSDDAGDQPPAGLLAEACAVHAELRRCGGMAEGGAQRRFPWSDLARVAAAAGAGDAAGAAAAVRAALASGADPAAVLVPAAADLLRCRQAGVLLELLPEVALPPALGGLLAGKAHLARGDHRAALAALATACAVPEPYFEARTLHAHALHACGQRREARRALIALADEAVHPQQPLGTAAEWAWRDRDHDAALDLFARAIAAAAAHRRGRLRCRRAELLVELGRGAEAVAELDLALAEDPGYARSAALRLSAGASPARRPHPG